LLGDKGYDVNWFRQALAARGITACIPSKPSGAEPIEHVQATQLGSYGWRSLTLSSLFIVIVPGSPAKSCGARYARAIVTVPRNRLGSDYAGYALRLRSDRTRIDVGTFGNLGFGKRGHSL
jgi:hypothetical protein